MIACVAVVCLTAGCGDSARTGSSPSTVKPLAIVGVPTPPFRVRGYDTTGTFPQVSGQGGDLRAVNAGLRAAVLADQRAFAPYALREKKLLPTTGRGDYRTALDGTPNSRSYVASSTAVVSALFPRTQEVFEGQSGGDGWLGITVRVPSGKRVTITDLFANPMQGIKALAAAWHGEIRRTVGAPCLRIYSSVYAPTPENYRSFALTATGIAVGTPEEAACYRLSAIVPYSTIRPYLSTLGSTLITGVRQPR
jgi:hypothetical protein